MSKKHRRRNLPVGKPAAELSGMTPALAPVESGRSGTILDIVMPIFGEWDMAEKAAASVPSACEGLNEGYRLIVVDNGTPPWRNGEGQEVSAADQAIGIKSKMRPTDVFLRLDQNMGYPGGCNHGVARGRSPLILIWTADVTMDPGTIPALVREFDDPSVGVVGAFLRFPMDESPHGPSGKVQHAGVAFNIRGDPFHVFIGWSPDNPRVNQRRAVAAVTGAFFATRRPLWERINGFSQMYGGGTFEDLDFCFSVADLGQQVIFNPAIRGYHYVGGSIKKGAMRPGFNLPLNATIFRGRWAQKLQWDEWRYW